MNRLALAALTAIALSASTAASALALAPQFEDARDGVINKLGDRQDQGREQILNSLGDRQEDAFKSNLELA